MSKPESDNPPSYIVSTQPVLAQPVAQVQYVQQVDVVQEVGNTIHTCISELSCFTSNRVRVSSNKIFVSALVATVAYRRFAVV